MPIFFYNFSQLKLNYCKYFRLITIWHLFSFMKTLSVNLQNSWSQTQALKRAEFHHNRVMQQLGKLALFWSSWHVSLPVAFVLSTSIPFSAVAASTCQNVTVEAKEARAIRCTHTKKSQRFNLTTAWIILMLFFFSRPLACFNALLTLLALLGFLTETAGHWERQHVTVSLWLTSLLGNMCYEMTF